VEVIFYLHFPSRRAANKAAAFVRERGYSIKQVLRDDDRLTWVVEVQANIDRRAKIARFDSLMYEWAEMHGGEYDDDRWVAEWADSWWRSVQHDFAGKTERKNQGTIMELNYHLGMAMTSLRYAEQRVAALEASMKSATRSAEATRRALERGIGFR